MSELLNILGTFAVVAIAIVLGLVVFFVVASIISQQGHDDRVQEMDTAHQNASHARDMERQNLLWSIKATPEHQRGAMWAKYRELEKIHGAMDDAENIAIAKAYTVIDDQTAYELENGINPYAKPQKQTTRAAKLRAAKVWR